ncbi:MAG: (2Fe-2S)-binding protein [Thermodesulfobacteriota bacterium]
MIRIRVNGRRHELDVDPATPLLWVLRDHLWLTGTKYGCGIGECGACTVHVDGEAVKSCAVTVREVAGRDVTTIEGLQGQVGDALRRAWIEEDVAQCGYCQPGQIMTAAALLAHGKKPTEAELEEAMSAVLCRCGTYREIRRALERARGELRRD